jgi:ketosteroid isomerase-like protein
VPILDHFTEGETLMNRMLAALACVAAFAAPATATEPGDALRPVHQFVESMNKGDLVSAVAACGDEMSIIDNVPPYQWHGQGACEKWASSVETDSTHKGLTDVVFKIGEATHVAVSDDHAYAVLPASYTFKEKGKPGGVEGTLTAAMQKTPTGWHMTGFAFAER